MSQDEVKPGGIVRVPFAFTQKDLDKAIAWGREKNFSLESDGHFSSLLLLAACAGVFEPRTDFYSIVGVEWRNP